MRVSVVVPNFNHARYLPRRLESIFAQSYKDFELIVLDDASSDESVAIIESYQAQHDFRLIKNSRNSGSPFAQWRKGAEICTGDLLWIAESDDYAHPDLLRRLVSCFDNEPLLALAYCQSIRVDSRDSRVDGETWSDWSTRFHPTHWKADFVADGIDEIVNYLIHCNTIPNASAALVRRTLLLDAIHGGEQFRLSGDWRAWIAVLLRGPVAHVATPYNFFRVHEHSVRDTMKKDATCAEKLLVQAHTCSQVSLSWATRERLFWDERPEWKICLRNCGLVGHRSWILGTMVSMSRIWPPAVWFATLDVVRLAFERVSSRLFNRPLGPA